MRPKHYQLPERFKKGPYIFKDRVLFVHPVPLSPDFVHEEISGWGDTRFFPIEQPLIIEYCSGNGDWIVNRALNDPYSNYIAVEMKIDRTRKIWSKLKNNHLENLLIVCGEAFHISKNFLPAHVISHIFINFPDPWPKRRHAPYRLVQPPFVSDMGRTLQKGGSLTLVTDDPTYSFQMIRCLQGDSQFESYFGPPFYSLEMAGYGSSYFESLWRDQGKVIYYHKFFRRL